MNDELNNNDTTKPSSTNVSGTNNGYKILIIVFVVIVILLVVLFFNKFNNPKLQPIVTPNYDTNNEIIETPNDNDYDDDFEYNDEIDDSDDSDDNELKVYYTDVSSMKYINAVYKNKYFVSAKALYDVNGKTLRSSSDNMVNINMEHNYFYGNKNLYSLNGKHLIRNIDIGDNDIYIDKNYIIINKTIYYDQNGELIFDGSLYDSIREFDGKCAIVYDKNSDGYSIVDSNNNYLTNGSYSYISKLNDDIFKIQKKLTHTTDFYFYSAKSDEIYGPVAYYQMFDGNKIIVDVYNGNSEDRTSLVEENKLSTYILNLDDFSTKSFNKVRAHNFKDTIFNGKYLIYYDLGYDGFKEILYDTNFNKVRDVKYDEITNVKDEYAILTLGSKQTVVNKDLKELFSFEYDETAYLDNKIYYNENLFIVNNEETYFLFDKNGKSLYNSPATFYVAYSYENYYFFIEDADDYNKCFYMDINKDKKIKEIDYSFCNKIYYSSNQFILKKENNKYALYDVSLKPVLNEKYDYLELFDNYYLAINNDEIYVMSYNGEKLVEDKFVDYDLINRVISHDEIDEMDALLLYKEDGSVYYFNYE